ncbi:MAG: helix-turn-helix transcriptional regulator, partial [Muribaculaceae bacterium]|nr:helix-turn-helix transcriptional regulator [Muribaculaceae bacterium]
EVLYQIAQGKTSREIAAAMFVSDNTVEAHRKSLFAKLGAINVADLIVKAINSGYIKKSGVKR